MKLIKPKHLNAVLLIKLFSTTKNSKEGSINEKKMKVTLLTTVLLSTGIFFSNHVKADSIKSMNVTSNIKNSIDDWMPNKALQNQLLVRLVSQNILPQGSTVEDITQSLLENIPDTVPININLKAQTSNFTPTTLKGLEYIKQADIAVKLVVSHTQDLLNVDTNYVPSGTEKTIGNSVGKMIVAPKSILTQDLYKNVYFGTEPLNIGVAGSIQGEDYTPEDNTIKPSISGVVSLNNYETLHLKSSDFKDFYFGDLANENYIANVFDTVTGKVVSPESLYTFVQNDDEITGNYIKNSTNDELMEQVKPNPDRYLIMLADTANYIVVGKVIIAESIKFMSYSPNLQQNYRIPLQAITNTNSF
jgi:hypothetical protein